MNQVIQVLKTKTTTHRIITDLVVAAVSASTIICLATNQEDTTITMAVM